MKHLNPVLKVIFCGVFDDDSPFSYLRGIPHVLQTIWRNIVLHWKLHIIDGKEVIYDFDCNFEEHPERLIGGMGFVEISKVKFPKPKNININMMPFVMASRFEDTGLPKNLKPYHMFIYNCIRHDYKLNGKIGYLTVHESKVKPSTSQRRPGIHVESPGYIMIDKEDLEDLADIDTVSKEDLVKGRGFSGRNPMYLHWGMGYHHQYNCHGGIYMASNVENSCKLWNCQILRNDNYNLEVVGELGDIEHLRELLPPTEQMAESNTMYWLTDRTPHESIPLKNKTYRQFFRLVTDEVSVWFEEHSTKNPNGIVPDPNITKIVKGNKFDKKKKLVLSDS